MILLGDRPLTLADVEQVARGRTTVAVGSEARARMKRARGVIDDAVRDGRVVYGVTTGFGELKDRHIPPEQVRELQLNLIRSHRAGVGRFASRDTVRAMLLLRAASLAVGASGVRPELVEALLELLARGITPIVPLQGSVGASGDLAPLAHLAAVLTGEGEAWLGDQRMPAGLALRGPDSRPSTSRPRRGWR